MPNALHQGKRSLLVSFDCVSLLPQTTAIMRAKMLYERLVTQFPTSGRYWRLYIEQEVNLAWDRFLLPYVHDQCPLGSLGVVVCTCHTVVLLVEVEEDVEVDFTASGLQANLHAVLVMAMKVISSTELNVKSGWSLSRRLTLTCKTCMWVHVVIAVTVQRVVAYSNVEDG